MARFAVKTLEFDKVKALLASKTATSLGKAQALAIAGGNSRGTAPAG